MIGLKFSPFLRFSPVALILLVPVGLKIIYILMESQPQQEVQMEHGVVKEHKKSKNNKNRNNKIKEESGQAKENNNDTIPPFAEKEKGEFENNEENNLRSSREAERNLLILLNKRFEKIIEKNRQLEQANTKLTSQFEITQKECAVKVTEVTSKVNKQLQEALNDAAAAKKEAQALSFQVETLEQDAEDLKTRLDKAVDETGLQQKTIGELENKIGKLESQLRKEVADKTKLQKELKDSKDQNKKIGDNLTKVQKNLENECLSKLDLESQLKGQIEETSMKSTLMMSEMTQLKATTDQMLKNRDEQQQKEFDKKLEKCMEGLRNEYNRKLDENKTEQSKLYSMKESEYTVAINGLRKQVQDKTQEVGAAEAKLGQTRDSLTKLEGERNELKSKLAALESDRKAEREKLLKEIKDKDELLEQKAIEKKQYLTEYQHLLDIKVALDNELATYRVLLETEELRLHIGVAGIESQIIKDENDNTINDHKN